MSHTNRPYDKEKGVPPSPYVTFGTPALIHSIYSPTMRE